MNEKLNIYQKIDLIIERIEGYLLYNSNTAKLSYSGGRDSHLLLHIIRNILHYDNNKLPAIYTNTYNEYNDIRHRIEEQDITIVDSGRRIFEVFESEGLPLFSKDLSSYFYGKYIRNWNIQIRNEKILKDYSDKCNFIKCIGCKASDKCCKIIKEDLLKKAKIVGLRKDEGGRRSKVEYDFCVKENKKLFKPIFDVTNEELTELEKVLNIKNPEIYNHLERTGCVMCGFGTKKQIKQKLEYLAKFEPKRCEFYIKYFNDYLKYRGII